MIKIDWTKFVDEHGIIRSVYQFIRNRMWYGWWWASICSMHIEYNKTCRLCRTGDWVNCKNRSFKSIKSFRMKERFENIAGLKNVK